MEETVCVCVCCVFMYMCVCVIDYCKKIPRSSNQQHEQLQHDWSQGRRTEMGRISLHQRAECIPFHVDIQQLIWSFQLLSVVFDQNTNLQDVCDMERLEVYRKETALQ